MLWLSYSIFSATSLSLLLLRLFSLLSASCWFVHFKCLYIDVQVVDLLCLSAFIAKCYIQMLWISLHPSIWKLQFNYGGELLFGKQLNLVIRNLHKRANNSKLSTTVKGMALNQQFITTGTLCHMAFGVSSGINSLRHSLIFLYLFTFFFIAHWNNMNYVFWVVCTSSNPFSVYCIALFVAVFCTSLCNQDVCYLCTLCF